jgi:hypothetical protein
VKVKCVVCVKGVYEEEGVLCERVGCERSRILQILTLWQDTEPIKRSAGIPHILEGGKYKKI